MKLGDAQVRGTLMNRMRIKNDVRGDEGCSWLVAIGYTVHDVCEGKEIDFRSL